MKKLIIEKIYSSVFFALPYNKAASIAPVLIMINFICSYRLMVKNNMHPKLFTILKIKNAAAVFQYKPFLERKVIRFEQTGHKTISRKTIRR